MGAGLSARLLERIVTVGVGHDRAVPVDAAAQKVPQPFIGYAQRAESKALCGHESDLHQPAVEEKITPLQAIDRPWIDALCDPRGDVEASPGSLEQIDIL